MSLPPTASSIAESAASAPARPEKIRLQAVSKIFRSGEGAHRHSFYAVREISLTIQTGEFLALVGPSGCGKTTLLNLIAGFEHPDEGGVLCDGKPVTGPGSDRLVLFQEHGLLPWLSVCGNVEFGLRMKGLKKSVRREKAMHYLKMVHLLKFADSFPFQLSGGMKQRAAIARALAVEPHTLLMDEPFSSLDPRTRDLLHLELQDLWLSTRKTIVFVTHSVEEALRLADRIVVMASQPGRIRRIVNVEFGRPRDFFDPNLGRLRVAILEEFEDELNKLAQREGDDDWSIKEGALRRRRAAGLGAGVGGRH